MRRIYVFIYTCSIDLKYECERACSLVNVYLHDDDNSRERTGVVERVVVASRFLKKKHPLPVGGGPDENIFAKTESFINSHGNRVVRQRANNESQCCLGMPGEY